MQILRIEDPNTHEALDLNKISNRGQTKAPASDETGKAPASDDNNKTEQSAPKAEIPVQEAETKTEVKEEEQPESAKTPETEEKPAETEGQESKTTPEEVRCPVICDFFKTQQLSRRASFLLDSMDVTLRCGQKLDSVWRHVACHVAVVLIVI